MDINIFSSSFLETLSSKKKKIADISDFSDSMQKKVR